MPTGKGRYHTINVPLNNPVKDGPFVELFERVVSAVVRRWCPDVLVMCAGADMMRYVSLPLVDIHIHQTALQKEETSLNDTL